MKLKNIILLVALSLIGLSSCINEKEMANQDGLVTFNATYERAPQTKTVLEGLTPMWTPEDKITVYDGVNNEFVNTEKSKTTASTSFKGKLEGKGRKYYLAAYPYNPDLTFSFFNKSIYDLYMPVEQVAVENTYDPAAALAYAFTENYELSFKNAGSLIKFKIISEGVTSVTLRPNGEEIIAGKFNLTYGENPVYTITKGEKEIKLVGDFKKDAIYYIVTLPVTLTDGLTVLLNENIKTFSESYQIDLARSGLINLGSLSLNPSESQPDPQQKLIYLKIKTFSPLHL